MSRLRLAAGGRCGEAGRLRPSGRSPWAERSLLEAAVTGLLQTGCPSCHVRTSPWGRGRGRTHSARRRGSRVLPRHLA